MLWTIVQKLDLMKFRFHTSLYGFDMATRRMGLKHVEAFRAVFVTGSMTQAAQRMHTSQPQISRLIGQLEAITQFPLFDRSGGRLRPTVDGSRFFQEVEKTFIGLAGLEASAVSIRSFGMGRLSVAAMPRLAGGMLTRITARFKADYPHVMVSIRSGTASAVHNWVNSGLCDTGLAMLYDEVAGVHVEPVLKTRCVAIMPKGHRLAQKKTLRPADFADEAFISFATGSPLYDRIDTIFGQAGVTRRIVAETDLGASVCALVAAGLGISIINPIAAHDESAGAALITRPFNPAVPVTIALFYPPYAARGRLIDVFSEYARKVMSEELGYLER
jgi:DNA-binding transcriptional LysR family regulator